MQGEDKAVTHEAAEAFIAQVEKQIADLKRRWPAHSVPPAMLQELDELEEELERLRKSANRPSGTAVHR